MTLCKFYCITIGRCGQREASNVSSDAEAKPPSVTPLTQTRWTPSSPMTLTLDPPALGPYDHPVTDALDPMTPTSVLPRPQY